jgi:hypothetical protein
MAATKKAQDAGMDLPKLNLKETEIRIVGDTPLIVHAWSQKAIKEMLDKQMKRANAGKEAKNPDADYEQSLYKLEDGAYGFPSVGFKSAAVTACTSLAGMTKVAARQAFRVTGEMAKIKTVYNAKEMSVDMVRIEGEPEMREDMVRVGMGTADIRYRGQFFPWCATLHVLYNANVMSEGQITNLFNTAGFAVGVGEWRPEKDGQYGCFHVDTKAKN